MAISTIKTLDPASRIVNSEKRAAKRALTLFHDAARRVPAYKDFLHKNGVDPQHIRTIADFAHVPLTDKPSYMTQYSLDELSWDGALSYAKCVSTSSGSTGVPSFWPRGQTHDVAINLMLQRLYEEVFNTRTGSTLCVNSFALGPWIAGFEFYNGVKWTAERGSNMTMLTPGIDKAEAVKEILKLSGLFDRVIIGGYPPFLKDIIEEGRSAGIDWSTIDLRLLAGGEAVSDYWKDRILEMIGRPGEFRRIMLEYGMAEAGVLANETPVSAVVRRSLGALSKHDAYFPRPEEVVGLYQYYPGVRYFEGTKDGTLAMTSDAGLPLIKYETRDAGGTLTHDDVLEHGGQILRDAAAQHEIDLESWSLPFVYLRGRKDFSVSLYALNIYVENIKRALESSSIAVHLSGLFTMSVTQTPDLDQRFELVVELARDEVPTVELVRTLTLDAVQTLKRVNAEYAKLHESIGERAVPIITLVRSGDIQTIPGRKHKWFKRES